MSIKLFVVAAAAAVLAARSAAAAVLHCTAKMDGAAETPPNDSKGTGTAAISLDTSTKTLEWKAEYSSLSGPVTAAHFHGPAPAGKPAGVAVPLKGELAS